MVEEATTTTDIMALYHRRDDLKAELAELDAALTLLRCSHCGAHLVHQPEHDANSFLTGELGHASYFAIFQCETCQQQVRLTQTLWAETVDGKRVHQLAVGARIIEHGTLFMLKPPLDILWIED